MLISDRPMLLGIAAVLLVLHLINHGPDTPVDLSNCIELMSSFNAATSPPSALPPLLFASPPSPLFEALSCSSLAALRFGARAGVDAVPFWCDLAEVLMLVVTVLLKSPVFQMLPNL